MATSTEPEKDSNAHVELSSPEETKENCKDPELKDETDVFSCPVCLEHFKNPKCLPCQHTFCETCIDTYIQSSQNESKDGGPSTSFLCPVCRQTVESPKSDSKSSEWAASLPTNQMILSLMDNSAKSDDMSERFCDSCKRDNESSPGIFWCQNCSECLCETCRRFHRRIKTSVMHKVVPIEEMERMSIGMTQEDELCPEHQEESLKVYCVGHKKMCCVMCWAGNHRKCKEIKTIQETTEQMIQNKEDKNFIKILQALNIKAGEVSKSKQDNMCYLDKRHQDLTGEVENLVDQAKANLDNFREQFKSKFNALHKEQNMKLRETKDRVDCFQNNLHNGEKMLQTVADNGTNLQFFFAMEKLKTRLGSQLLNLKFGSEDDSNIDYDLCIEDILTQDTKDNTFAHVYPQLKPCVHEILPTVEAVLNMADIGIIIADDETKAEATFKHTFENISKLEKTQLSPPCMIRNLPWKIMIMKSSNKSNEKTLGFYLHCSADSKSESWSCNAYASLKILNWNSDGEPFIQEFQCLFNSKENYWGYPDFMSWSDLFTASKGFVKDDKITLEVSIKADVPQGE